MILEAVHVEVEQARKRDNSDYIMIPKDFTSLHDLKDLVNNYDLVSRLSMALRDYQWMYIDSHFMTMEEVLDYIPEKQHDKYVMNIRDRKYDTNYRYEKKLSLKQILALANPQKNEKLFIVNTTNKKIDAMFWALKDLKPRKRKENDWRDSEVCDVTYKGKIDFELDANKQLLVKAHYSFTDSQAVGGVMINGAGGYLSGHSYHDYTRDGYDIYSFCTLTNKYLGYKGCKQDPARPWIKKTSRY